MRTTDDYNQHSWLSAIKGCVRGVKFSVNGKHKVTPMHLGDIKGTSSFTLEESVLVLRSLHKSLSVPVKVIGGKFSLLDTSCAAKGKSHRQDIYKCFARSQLLSSYLSY